MALRRDGYNWELNPQADDSPGARDSSHHHTMTIVKSFEGKCCPKRRRREKTMKEILST